MTQLKPSVGQDDHTQGPLDAGIVLVEYGDFECPYCGEAYPELKAAQAAMGDSLCFAFRNFPLSNAHPHAERAAEFAEAAATIDRFWQMHDLLYENQQALDERSLIGYAKQLGFDNALIESALRGDFSARVRRDFTSGMRSGVNGTPCLFVNGQRYDGPRDADTLIDLFKRMD
ncbi:MAG TPA: DsbA family protein [Rhodanobacteraceae bacterium]|jgi:protein-disulfide isomerase|nr:DsbA family protein [Rhodanobacteraceae bacterium]